ncbi:MAG: hypothetical protein ABI317_11430 [Gaiellales bacterium]
MSYNLRFQAACTRLCRFLVLIAVAAAIIPVAAAADTPPPGDIPDSQAFVVFHDKGFSIKVPEGWARVTHAGSTAFIDKYNGIAIAVSRRAKAPTVSNVTRGELARLKASTLGFAQPRLSAVSRPAGSGVLVTYRASSVKSSVTGKRISNDVERYELWHAGKVAVLTLQAPHGSDNIDAWRLVTTSFRWAS